MSGWLSYKFHINFNFYDPWKSKLSRSKTLFLLCHRIWQHFQRIIIRYTCRMLFMEFGKAKNRFASHGLTNCPCNNQCSEQIILITKGQRQTRFVGLNLSSLCMVSHDTRNWGTSDKCSTGRSILTNAL